MKFSIAPAAWVSIVVGSVNQGVFFFYVLAPVVVGLLLVMVMVVLKPVLLLSQASTPRPRIV